MTDDERAIEATLENCATALADMKMERDALRSQLGRAYREMSCCDDVNLGVPLGQSISELQQHRENAERDARRFAWIRDNCDVEYGNTWSHRSDYDEPVPLDVRVDIEMGRGRRLSQENEFIRDPVARAEGVERNVRTSSAIDGISCGDLSVSHDYAAKAVDDLDDYARMGGIVAEGPVHLLERYIAQQRRK